MVVITRCEAQWLEAAHLVIDCTTFGQLSVEQQTWIRQSFMVKPDLSAD